MGGVQTAAPCRFVPHLGPLVVQRLRATVQGLGVLVVCWQAVVRVVLHLTEPFGVQRQLGAGQVVQPDRVVIVITLSIAQLVPCFKCLLP